MPEMVEQPTMLALRLRLHLNLPLSFNGPQFLGGLFLFRMNIDLSIDEMNTKYSKCCVGRMYVDSFTYKLFF